MSFDDLCAPLFVSKGSRMAVHNFIGSLPEDIRELLCTWHGTMPLDLMVCGIHDA